MAYFFPLFIHGTPADFIALFLAKLTQIVDDLESAMKSHLGRATGPPVQHLPAAALWSLLLLIICTLLWAPIPCYEPESH